MPTENSQILFGVLEACRFVLGGKGSEILLHRPEIGRESGKLVDDCLVTGWVSSAGRYVREFEQELAAFVGAPDAVAVVNGTAALQVALVVAGVKPGDEVICPSLTFVATANAVRHAGANPHFVEVEESTFGIDPDRLRRHLAAVGEMREGRLFNKQTGRPISAICPMHCLGHPVRIERLLEVATEFGLDVVEDAAESLGSCAGGKHTGLFGKIGCFSFNGNKIITTGGGGALVSEDTGLLQRARHLTTTARVGAGYEFIHDEVAWNFRMPNINAALGLGQLRNLESILTRKRILADRYREAFASHPGVRFLDEPSGCRSNYWLNAIILDEGIAGLRDEILATLNQAGIQSRPLWRPMHLLPMYQDCPRSSMTITESLAARTINIPSSPDLIPAGS